MNQTVKYKKTGLPWCPEIPKDWDVKKLKFMAEINLGKMLTDKEKEGYFLKPYLRAANILWEGADVSFVKEMWFSQSELQKLKLKKGDLLVSEGGEVGRTGIWNDELEECYIQNSVHKVSFFKDYSSKYFLYSFITYGFIGLFEAIVNRISIGHLTGEKLKEISFPVPPLPQQKAIASYLDQKTAEIDNLISKKQSLIECLKEERTAIINEAVTKGINPDVEMKETGIEWLGKIPAHWEVKKLKYVLSQKLEYGANESAIESDTDNPRYLRISDFDENGKLRDDTFKSLPFNKAKDFLLQKGDILFARSGATVGKTFIFWDYEGKACFAGYLIKARPNLSLIDPIFLYQFTKSNAYENWKNSIFNQSTIQNIGADKYCDLETPIPGLAEQSQIVSYMEAHTKRIDTSVSKIEQEIELIKEYRIALINEVVTGKKQVL